MQLSELKDELQPLVQMVKDGKIPPGKVSIFVHLPQSASDNTLIDLLSFSQKGADYLRTKQQLYLKWVAVTLFLDLRIGM